MLNRIAAPRSLAACLSVIAGVAAGAVLGAAPDVALDATSESVVASTAGAARANADGALCESRSPLLDALGEAYYTLDDAATPEVPAALAAARTERHGARRVRARRLHLLLERLYDGDLRGGGGERIVCRGGEPHPWQIRWQLDLEQLERVGTLGGQTLLTAFESRHTPTAAPPERRLVDGALVAESIDLPARASWRPDEAMTELRSGRRFRRLGAHGASCALPRSGAPFAGVAALHLRPRADTYPETLTNTPTGANVGSGGSASRGGRADVLALPDVRCTYLTEIALSARAVGDTIELEQTLYVNGRGAERVLWRLGR